MNKQLSRIGNQFVPWALPILLIVVWQIASQTGWLSNRILPSPEAIVVTFWNLSASGELWQHLAISSWRAAVGFSIGGSIGLILGLITGMSRLGERLLDTSVQMLRNVPHLALMGTSGDVVWSSSMDTGLKLATDIMHVSFTFPVSIVARMISL